MKFEAEIERLILHRNLNSNFTNLANTSLRCSNNQCPSTHSTAYRMISLVLSASSRDNVGMKSLGD